MWSKSAVAKFWHCFRKACNELLQQSCLPWTSTTLCTIITYQVFAFELMFREGESAKLPRELKGGQDRILNIRDCELPIIQLYKSIDLTGQKLDNHPPSQILRLTCSFKSKWVGEPDNHPPCWTGQSEKAMQALGTRWSFSWNKYCVQKIQTFCIFYSGLWKYICCSFLDYHFVCRKVSLSFLTIVFGDFCQLSFLFVDFASKFGE